MIEICLWAIGLILVFEGLVYVLAPSLVEAMLQYLQALPLSQRLFIRAVIALLGAIILWAARIIASRTASAHVCSHLAEDWLWPLSVGGGGLI